MINMPYLQTFITTQFLHLEQSLTQQISVGWIRVSKAADVNIYYKLSCSKSLLTEALHMDCTCSEPLQAIAGWLLQEPNKCHFACSPDATTAGQGVNVTSSFSKPLMNPVVTERDRQDKRFGQLQSTMRKSGQEQRDNWDSVELRQSFSSFTPWAEQGRGRPQPCIFLHAFQGQSHAWSKTIALILSVHASIPTVLGSDKAKRKIERVSKTQPARRCSGTLHCLQLQHPLGKGCRCTWQPWWRRIHGTGIFPWVGICCCHWPWVQPLAGSVAAGCTGRCMWGGMHKMTTSHFCHPLCQRWSTSP